MTEKSTSATLTSSKKATPKEATAKDKKRTISKAHPPASEMILAAITALKDRKGSSLQAIKKYIAAHYKVDAKRQAVYIRKFLKTAVEKKMIVQTNGAGASGRFKLASKTEDEKRKPVAKKSVGDKNKVTRKSTAKKTALTKKSPSKAKRNGKAPAAAKPKSPKPKKVAASKVTTSA